MSAGLVDTSCFINGCVVLLTVVVVVVVVVVGVVDELCFRSERVFGSNLIEWVLIVGVP